MTKQSFPEHPFTLILKILCPLIGGNFEVRSGRDTETAAKRYPVIDYAILFDSAAEYDRSRNVWKVTSVVQFDYLIEEAEFLKYCEVNELDEIKAIQAQNLHFARKLRELVSVMVNPESLTAKGGPKLKELDFVFSKYEFRLVRLIESFPLRNHGPDHETGVASRFEISFLDVDSSLCCSAENKEDVLKILTEGSVSFRLLENSI